jgi:hypothetical protein
MVDTYKPPIAKAQVSAIFATVFRWILHTYGKGRINRVKSVMIFGTAFPMKKLLMSTPQCDLME